MIRCMRTSPLRSFIHAPHTHGIPDNIPMIVQDLSFGGRYDGSPIVISDGTAPPPDAVNSYQPTGCPGGRAPHLWLEEHRSLYDALGADYALVRVDPNVRVSGIVEAAACRGVPFALIDLDTPDAGALYTRKLTLIRPDQHVAWRSDEEPAAPLDLMDLVRGARPIPTERLG